MTDPTLTYEGKTYPVPTRLKIGEIAEGQKTGARRPTGPDDEPDIMWLGVLLMTAKRRAGERMDPSEVAELVLEEILFDPGSANGDGNGETPPPTGAAPRRGNAPKPKRGR